MVNSSFNRRVLPLRSLPPHHFETSRMHSKTWCGDLGTSIVAVWFWLFVVMSFLLLAPVWVSALAVHFSAMAISPVSSRDFRLERTSGQPPDTAVMSFDSGRSIS